MPASATPVAALAFCLSVLWQKHSQVTVEGCGAARTCLTVKKQYWVMGRDSTTERPLPHHAGIAHSTNAVLNNNVCWTFVCCSTGQQERPVQHPYALEEAEWKHDQTRFVAAALLKLRQKLWTHLNSRQVVQVQLKDTLVSQHIDHGPLAEYSRMACLN